MKALPFAVLLALLVGCSHKPAEVPKVETSPNPVGKNLTYAEATQLYVNERKIYADLCADLEKLRNENVEQIVSSEMIPGDHWPNKANTIESLKRSGAQSEEIRRKEISQQELRMERARALCEQLEK